VSRAVRTAGVGVLVAAIAAAALLLGLQAAGTWTRVLAPAPVRTDDVVVAIAATAGAAVAAWLGLGALVSASMLLRGSARRPVLVPAVVHRAVALALGLALAAGTAATDPSGPGTPAPPPPASAQPSPVHADLDPGWAPTAAATEARSSAPDAPPGVASSTGVDPGWRASAPPAAPASAVPVPGDPLLLDGRRAVPDERTLVTVRRGDTLWDLAARHLGPQATDAEIAAQWPRWYEANRAVVGDDPDLLLPGWRLQPPGGDR
jgi:nucleoid-associated protein YgaU